MIHDRDESLFLTDGLIILAESSITYLDDASEHQMTKELAEPTIFCAWEEVDSQRWLLADDYGRLYFLMLLISEDREVSGWKLDLLGTTSRASVLVYLDGGYVFIGSHQGDSQVISIQEKSFEIVQTISNIAPILDFAIMDMGSRDNEGQTNEYSSGQARIVTGSGAFEDGSLRSVRSGVGLEELGSLGEMDHITNLHPLVSKTSSQKTDTLVVSFIDETRVFQFDVGGDVEEAAEYKGFDLSEGTILALNLPQDHLLQVTKSFVRVNDIESGVNIATWSPSPKLPITAVAANDLNIAVSIGGVNLIVLDLASDLNVIAEKSFGVDRQIACIDLPTLATGICIVGFWQGAEVSILDLDTLEERRTIKISEDSVAVPRSILLTHILTGQPPTLFIAMADGYVITFSVTVPEFSLSARNSIVLGTQEANFRALPRGDGLFNVFATCEHPSLIYGSEGRIVYSAVTAEKASCICPFDSEAYPGAIAIATSEDLKMALVDTERTTHVRTLPIKETVRRVAYSAMLKAFGLGTVKRTLKKGVEVVQSHFKLADEIVFKELDTYDLNEDELVESVARADLSNRGHKTAERFIVGTAYLEDEKSDAVRGRIIVFEVTEDRILKVVTQIPVKGACRALGILDGRIVAALIKTVSHSSREGVAIWLIYSIGRGICYGIR